MKRATIVILLLFFASSLFAGPFGLEFGWTIEDMVKNGVVLVSPTLEEFQQDGFDGYYAWSEEDDDVVAHIEIIPPHTNIFSSYEVRVSSKLGLVGIKAAHGETIEPNEEIFSVDDFLGFTVSGSNASNLFDRVKQALVLKYGEENRYLSDGKMARWDAKANTEHVRIELRKSHDFSLMPIEQIKEPEYPVTWHVTLEYDKSDRLQAEKDEKYF